MSLFSKKETVKLSVKGMHCEKCVARVTEALEGVQGVTGATVSLDDESAVVEGHGTDVHHTWMDGARAVVGVEDDAHLSLLVGEQRVVAGAEQPLDVLHDGVVAVFAPAA